MPLASKFGWDVLAWALDDKHAIWTRIVAFALIAGFWAGVFLRERQSGKNEELRPLARSGARRKPRVRRPKKR